MDHTSFTTILRIYMRQQDQTGTRQGGMRVGILQKPKSSGGGDWQRGIERIRHGPDWPAR